MGVHHAHLAMVGTMCNYPRQNKGHQKVTLGIGECPAKRTSSGTNLTLNYFHFASTSSSRCRESQRWSVSMWTMPGARLKKAIVGTQERDAPCPVQIYEGTEERAPSISGRFMVSVGRKGGAIPLENIEVKRK